MKEISIADGKVIEIDRVCFLGERIRVDKAKKKAKRVDRANERPKRVDKIGDDLKKSEISNNKFEEIGIAE